MPADREVLIEQLDALRLRLPAGVVITSTGKVEPPSGEAVILDALLPDDEARTALMAATADGGSLIFCRVLGCQEDCWNPTRRG